MKQTKKMSLVESIANVMIGYIIAVLAQVLVFPLFGINIPLHQNLQIGAIFTVVSIVRSFVLRRVFEHIRVRRVN